MQVRIVSVDITRVKEGKKDYSKAQVIYTFNGQARTQNLISFANPAVFAIVEEWAQSLPSDLVEVEVGKNDKGYNEWRSIGTVEPGSAPSPATSSPSSGVPKTSTFTGGRDFETAVERAARQVLIVKQSCLAVAEKQMNGTQPAKEDVVALAQFYVDWIFEGNE